MRIMPATEKDEFLQMEGGYTSGDSYRVYLVKPKAFPANQEKPAQATNKYQENKEVGYPGGTTRGVGYLFDFHSRLFGKALENISPTT